MTEQDQERIAAEYGDRPSRLYEAAAFIERLPSEQFNMEHWWLVNGQAFDEERNAMYAVADGPCGCAVGHMVQRGLFGLEPDLLNKGRERIFVTLGDVFGIGLGRAKFLFDQYSYADRDRRDQSIVAKRMRFIADEAIAGGIK